MSLTPKNKTRTTSKTRKPAKKQKQQTSNSAQVYINQISMNRSQWSDPPTRTTLQSYKGDLLTLSKKLETLHIPKEFVDIAAAYGDGWGMNRMRDLDYLSKNGMTAEQFENYAAVLVDRRHRAYNNFDTTVTDSMVSLFPNATFYMAREGSVTVYVHDTSGMINRLGEETIKRALKAQSVKEELHKNIWRIYWS